MKKKAIIFGSTGQDGSLLAEFLLNKKYQVYAFKRRTSLIQTNRIDHLYYNNANKKNFYLDYCDITDPLNICKIILDIKPNEIYNLAAQSHVAVSFKLPFYSTIVDANGTLNILQIARKLKIKKFVYAASSSCYGLAKVPTKENHKIDPKYPYALSKLMGEQLVMHWCSIYKLPVVSIRIFNAYGNRVRTTGAYGAVFGVFLKQKLSQKPFTLVGNGKQRRDFLHVKDVVNAFYLSSKSKYSNKIYNLGAGSPKSILSLINIMGGKVIKIPKRPGEPECTWADINKIKREIKWKPKVNFKSGIEEMLLNIEDWKNAPLWNPKKIKKVTKSWFRYLN